MRVGLFGGSFDPIHLGHCLLAERAQAEAKLDQVQFIPCRQSPHKDQGTVANEFQRCHMIDIATAQYDWAELNTLELDRPEASYSWQTAQTIAQENPGAELFWILGSDQWDVIEKWARADLLAELLTFLVFPRGSHPEPKPGFRMQLLDHVHPASSTAARESREAAMEMLNPRVYSFALETHIYERWFEVG